MSPSSWSPLERLASWLEEAREAAELQPEAMSLATVSATGVPSLRTVSLKEIDDLGLVFGTTLYSLKALELRANPHAALLFHWSPLGRQVRVRGKVEWLDRAASELLFADRERTHQLQTVVSRQGTPLRDLEAIRTALHAAEERYREQAPACPPDWGGVRVNATLVEFWEGRADRLHERVEYRRDSEGDWESQRLAP